MASGKQHILIGSEVGVAAWLVYCKIAHRPVNLFETALAAGIGALGGLVPDLLEPALHPNHRAFFHSYAAGGLLAVANHHLSRNQDIDPAVRAAVHLGSLGFAIHLWADAGTPKGLPFA